MKINGKKILKITGISLLSIIVLLIVFIFSLRIPAVQNYFKGKLVHYLEEKIHTKVSLERVYVNFPNKIELQKLFLQGQDVDTLLSVKNLEVGLDIPQLMNNKVDLTSIDLQGARANVVRKPNGTFNFDYIIDAFATKEKDESPSKPFIISLDKIKLNDIGVNFIDQQSKNDIHLYFKSFDTRVKTFDLDKNTYAVKDINMDGLRLKLKQDLVEEVAANTKEKVDSLSEKKPLKIGLNKINLTHFDIDYGDDNTKTFAKVRFEELSTKVNQLDLEKQAYDVDNVSLKGADILANLYLPTKKVEPEKVEISKPEEKPGLSLLLGKLYLDDVKVAYHNTAVAPTKSGMDFNHLQFSKLNVDVRDFKMQDGTFSGKVKKGEIKESRGLDIQKFNTDFVYDKQEAYLKDLYLKTPKTLIQDEVVLNYNSIQQLSANPGAVQVFANIKNSKLAFSDILMLAPGLKNTVPFNKYPHAILNLNTRIKGSVNDLNIQNLQLSGIDNTVVIASGRIKNAMNPKKLGYDLHIREVTSSAKTVFNLVPKGTIPKNISLPSQFTIKGTAKGTTEVVQTQLNLATTLGNALVNADVDMRHKNHEVYDIKANLQNLQLGKIIQNKELGSITANITAEGVGFDPKTMNTSLSGKVEHVVYQNYRYQNMNLNGKINHGVYEIHLDSRDPNANLKLFAAGVYNEKNPTVKINGDIRKLDLHKLGFYNDPMILAGSIDGDFRSLNPDALNGYLNLKNFAISDTKEVYPLQEVLLKAVSTDSLNQITLKSQIADIDLKGKYKLTQIFGSLQNTINQYYQFQKATSGNKKIDPHQYFTFNATLKDDDLIRKFVPDLKSFETISLVGNYDADTHKINVDGKIPQVVYGGNSIENASLSLNNENDALQYNLHVGSAKNESLELKKLDVTGDVANNIISYTMTTKDDKDAVQFLIAGTAKSLNQMTEISLRPDGLKLNYDDWTVSPDNFIQFGAKGILANHFVLSKGESTLGIQSESQVPNSPLNVSISNFKIETLTEMIKKDSLLARGTINGTAQIRDLKNTMTLTSDLKITDLGIFGNPVGDVSAKIKNTSPKVFNADIALTGNDNDVKILGDYNTQNSGFDLNLMMNKLQMKTAEAFSMKNIENAEGYLSGNLKITGTTKNPHILGKVKFNDVGLGITKLGSNFKHINDAIDFTSRGIEFNKFKINDATGNSLTIDGDVLTETYRDFAFNLKVRGKDFKVVDSKEDLNKLMYGVLAVDTNLNIKGNLDLPVIDGRLTITDKTDFTFVLPQSSPTLQDREGIVEFIDQDQVALQGTIKQDSISSQTKVKGMDVNVNIEVNKEAKISLLIDKANGDFVKLQGEAQLTGGMDPSGKTTLVGVYRVEKGAYEMSVSLMKRKFDIQKGSTITWTGEPTTANLDITAIYKTEAPPIDLVEQQLSGLSASEINMYKQKIPFNTLLQMKGELLKPEITFDITMNDDNPSVATSVVDNTKTKLEQLKTEPSEMNKQVFALLLLNRFIGENPFESSAGTSAETLARQSVSRILSEQLNNLASDLIQGVDLNFNLDSSDDYSSGSKNTRTDLNVDISKKLLNDRLKVTIGSNFGLEGEARQNEQTTNIAGDVRLDYMLSKDGRYMLRAYRKNQYQVALQGQIIETGIGFVITMDYNKFKEIFQKSKKNQRTRNQQNQNKTTEKNEK